MTCMIRNGWPWHLMFVHFIIYELHKHHTSADVYSLSGTAAASRKLPNKKMPTIDRYGHIADVVF
jgi:hypothetical protein